MQTKKFRPYLYLLTLFVLLCGCRKENGSSLPSLNEKEYYYGDQLSSISPDGDSTCFICNEKGDLGSIFGNTARRR